MAKKETLIEKFSRKHFTGSPAHMLRSVKVGEFLFKYFLPDAEMPKDPATLLNITRNVMLANEKEFSDQDFVRMMLVQIDQDPSLITFDMIADLVESDAYKKFGTKANSNDAYLKSNFENWVLNNSMLSKIDSVFEGDVVLNKDAMKRVAAALTDKQNVQYTKTLNQKIDAKVNDFNEVFVNNVGVDDLDRLVALNQDNTQDFAAKLKGVYGVLGGEKYGEALGARFDGFTAGQDSKTRNTLFEGEALHLNKILLGVAQQKGWTDEQVNKILVKTPVERRAEKFAPRQDKNFHPVLDVVKTFGLTLGGATAISTITAIPGVGSVVGPVLGLTTVIGAGATSFIKSLKESKAKAQASGEKLKKTDAAKIALRTGIAMMGKAIPYAAAMALGPKFRAVGAGIVMAQTMLKDLDRRADLQRETVEEYEARQGKPKNIFARIGNVVRAVKEKRLKGSDFVKATSYGAAKGAAVYLGGALGREIGSSIGSRVDTDMLKNKMGKVTSIFNKGLRSDVAMMDNGNQHEYNGNHTANQLSNEDLNRLQKIAHIDLTENARATVDVHNQRQYIGGTRGDWYNFDEQQHAIQTLHNAGVDDAEGVLRKIGSMARFESAGEIAKGGYQNTLDHLKSGSINSQDVNNILESLSRINREGGLGSVESVHHIAPTPAPTPMYQSTPTMPDVSTEKPSVILPPESVNYQPQNYEAPKLEKVTIDPLPTYEENIHTPEIPVKKSTIIMPPESVNYEPSAQQIAPREVVDSKDVIAPAVESSIEIPDYNNAMPSFEKATVIDDAPSLLIPEFETADGLTNNSTMSIPEFESAHTESDNITSQVSSNDKKFVYNPFEIDLDNLRM